MLAPAVLIVDDDPFILDLVSHAIAAKGFRVIEAAEAREALEASAGYSGPIPLLLTDIAMPGINGLQLARRLRVERPEMQVLCITAYADVFDLHGFPVLRKPFTPDELLDKMQIMLSEGPRSAS